MILECACGKMYRVRDDAANQPTKCPVCGGALRQAGGSSPAVAAEPRIKEQETRIRTLEQERNDARDRAERLERELSGSRPGPGLSQTSAPLSDQVSELRTAAERADQLQREIFTLRSENERKLKDRDFEDAQVRQTADREGAERRKLESRLAGLEQMQARTLEGKQKTIDALDASVASYRAKVEQLQKQLESQELQRLADLNSFENRARERDLQDRAELDRVGQSHQGALTQLRKELEQKISDKDLQITEQRQVIDREAGERRRLSEVLSRLQENADRTVKEKQAALSAVEATLASFKSKVDALLKRVNDLEQLRRADLDAQAVRARSSQGARARLEEAGHFASDLDHNLDSVESLITNLRERMRRLKDTITTPTEPEPASPIGLGSLARFSPAPTEPEPAPALSQAGFEFAPSAPPSAEEPAPAESEVGFQGKVDPPSEVSIPAVRPSPQSPDPEPEPAIQEESISPLQEEPIHTRVAEATPLPATPSKEIEDAVPLISPPEEEEEAPRPAPPPKKEAPTRPRFSWKRK
jgi:chromosome segregation ATPase